MKIDLTLNVKYFPNLRNHTLEKYISESPAS